MRGRLVSMGLAAVMLTGSACYHARIETGAVPSEVVVQQNMASAWLWGLVKPPLTNVMSQCATGVARVETKHSVLNGLVHILTGGIYTPMTITVTCAKSGAAMVMPDGATVVAYDTAAPASFATALQDAARRTVAERRPVFVRAR